MRGDELMIANRPLPILLLATITVVLALVTVVLGSEGWKS
jgi:hypothetical protein